MKLRVTTLSENSATRPGTLAEHGISMFVEVDDFRLLLDTGQTTTAAYNARVLGVDLSPVHHIVLSHGHHDHTGGLKDVLTHMDGAGVYAHPEVFRARYSVPRGERVRYSGLPFLRDHLEVLGAEFHLSDGPTTLAPNVMTTGFVPRRTDFEGVPENLKVKTPSGWVQDDIPDDQAVVVTTPRGLVVLLGCAHAGTVNTLLKARELTGDKRVLAVMGGTHLYPARSVQLEKTVAALREFGVEKVGVSHCTGLPAAAMLAREFGERFFFNNVGTVTEWEL